MSASLGLNTFIHLLNLLRFHNRISFLVIKRWVKKGVLIPCPSISMRTPIGKGEITSNIRTWNTPKGGGLYLGVAEKSFPAPSHNLSETQDFEASSCPLFLCLWGIQLLKLFLISFRNQNGEWREWETGKRWVPTATLLEEIWSPSVCL